MNPSVAVIFPVNDVHEYLHEAIESLLNQTYDNFKVYLIDNSTDEFRERRVFMTGLREIARINGFQYLSMAPSSNLSQMLNHGISCSSSEYIIRMDSDDVAFPERIAKQVAFMEKSPNVAISGTGIEIIGQLNNHALRKGQFLIPPTDPTKMQIYAINKNPLFHPTVRMRRSSLLEKNLRYNEKYIRAQDLELWVMAMRKVSISNLPEVLLKYRLHVKQSGLLRPEKFEYFAELAKFKHSFWMVIHFKKGSFSAAVKMLKTVVPLIKHKIKN
jgi:glycosyltransferase involved in cell wall biosynthesis